MWLFEGDHISYHLLFSNIYENPVTDEIKSFVPKLNGLGLDGQTFRQNEAYDSRLSGKTGTEKYVYLYLGIQYICAKVHFSRHIFVVFEVLKPIYRVQVPLENNLVFDQNMEVVGIS